MTLLGATTPAQSEPGNDGNEGALHIPQRSRITRTSPSDCLASYTGHSLAGGGRFPHLCRDAVSVFYSPSWLGKLNFKFSPRHIIWKIVKNNYKTFKTTPKFYVKKSQNKTQIRQGR